MGEVILVPDPKCWLALSEHRKVNILTMVHNIRTFMAIEVCAFWHLPPFEVKFGHPSAGGFERDGVDDMVPCYHLRLPHKIDDSLGRNVCPNISDVHTQLLDEIGIIKKGTAPGVHIVVVWKSRAVPDKFLPPHSKPPTAASTLPEDGSSIISCLGPSFTANVDRKEAIKIIESIPEDNI